MNSQADQQAVDAFPPAPAERGGVLWWPVFLMAAAVMLAAAWSMRDIGAGIFFGILAFATALAAVDQKVGLLLLLSVTGFDKLIHAQFAARYSWYPLALHVLDPIAVALLLGWLVRFLRNREWREFAWYDWVAVAFLGWLGIEMARGMITGAEYVFRVGRVLPALAVYFPARSVLLRPQNRFLFAKWLLGYGILYGVAALVLAFIFRFQYGRPANDILLPRLCYVVDPRLFLLLLFIGWAALWRRALHNGRRSAILLGIVAIGILLAINNTRTFWIGLAVGWMALCWMLARVRSQPRVWLEVACIGLVCVAAGVLSANLAQAARPRLRFWVEKLQRKTPPSVQIAEIHEIQRSVESQLTKAGQRLKQAQEEHDLAQQEFGRAEAAVKKAQERLQELRRKGGPQAEIASLEGHLAVLQAKAAEAKSRLAVANRELVAAKENHQVTTGKLSEARQKKRVAEHVVSNTAPKIEVGVEALAANMRISAKGGSKSATYSIPDRLREARAVLSGLTGVSALIGHGIGAPLTYLFIEWNGKEKMRSFAFIHNSYFFFLHTSGIVGLGLCLLWLSGILTRGAKRVREIDSDHLALPYVAGILFTCASLVMALLVGTLNAPHAAPLFMTALCLVALEKPVG